MQLGQVRLVSRPRLAQTDYPCPLTPAPSYPSDLNCMRDARGNTICSDGQHYPPGCPHTPPAEYFTSGITPDVTTNGRIEGQIPAPKGAVSAALSSTPTLAFVGAGVAAAGAAAYFLFR